jgi:uncharacterized protein
MRDTGKNPFLRGWVGSLFVTLALFASLTPVWGQADRKTEEQPFLMAQGRGEVSVKPDVARIQVGVRTEAKEVTAAVQANATRMDAVLKAVRGAGVEEKDITTTNYSISPVYEPQRPNPTAEPTVRGYQVYNTVRVTVRKIGDAGKVLDAATQAGANAARGIAFELSPEQREKAYSEALTIAVKDARQKAVAMGKAAGVGMIALHSITEQDTGNFPQPMAAFEARAADVQTPVVAGQLTVTASVTARFLMSAGNPESLK